MFWSVCATHESENRGAGRQCVTACWRSSLGRRPARVAELAFVQWPAVVTKLMIVNWPAVVTDLMIGNGKMARHFSLISFVVVFIIIIIIITTTIFFFIIIFILSSSSSFHDC